MDLLDLLGRKAILDILVILDLSGTPENRGIQAPPDRRVPLVTLAKQAQKAKMDQLVQLVTPAPRGRRVKLDQLVTMVKQVWVALQALRVP
jgi:hypothetical protein